MKHLSTFTLGIERGASGYSAAWCFEMPGCYSLIPPGADPIRRGGLAILEFAAWSHNRAADRLTIDPQHIVVAQSIATEADLANGRTSAFFLHDADQAVPKEFPAWANAHDLALDELRVLTQSLPAALLDEPIEGEARTIRALISNAAATERAYAANLLGRDGRPALTSETMRDLQDAHRYLQEAICDVQPGLRVRREADTVHGVEDWSVRKTMRRSIWHLRYRTAEMRRSLASLWLAHQ